jgi:hypothetical protein
VVLELPTVCQPSWSASMHEPLILGLTLHFICFPPWQLGNTPRILDMGWTVQGLEKEMQEHVVAVLCKLCNTPVLLDGMSECMVWQLLFPSSTG